MKKKIIGTTSVYSVGIACERSASAGRHTRREREKAAVRSIASALGIEIGHAPDGAPTMDGGNISVSHSIGLAVVAVDPRRRIGIDAEDWRDALWRVRPKFLAEEEMALFVDEESLLRAWTAKEAVYKAAQSPRPLLTEIICSRDFDGAVARGVRYGLLSWLEGLTRVTLAYLPADES